MHKSPPTNPSTTNSSGGTVPDTLTHTNSPASGGTNGYYENTTPNFPTLPSRPIDTQ
jgi:hypothetical protein